MSSNFEAVLRCSVSGVRRPAIARACGVTDRVDDLGLAVALGLARVQGWLACIADPSRFPLDSSKSSIRSPCEFTPAKRGLESPIEAAEHAPAEHTKPTRFLQPASPLTVLTTPPCRWVWWWGHGMTCRTLVALYCQSGICIAGLQLQPAAHRRSQAIVERYPS